ncbi:BRE1-domain-containing protein [Rhodofomes roseus]|uniref:E3 ubiquitin protein ligase n=1 Tax=Rhodofomes roseus TaxID=34475 RepID=A0ABQ8KMD0_9APHY|nr:BRE1-domain-containing protein [Rhodofomes roseus]KAH9839472.1 BRE1-domain-containing protein [Rhodofomes roseus]
MAETKKRPYADDAEQSLPKKRAVSEEKPAASLVNGVESHPDEPRDSDQLEMFRKDAIYRRMKYYSREWERSEARVAELERRRSTCEAGLAALEACWIQIIGTIRMLVKPDDLPPVDVSPHELYDLTAHVSDDADPQYVESLRGKMQATTELVSAFVRLGGQTQVRVMQDEEFRTRQKAQTEESSLRAELSLARTRLRDMEAERDIYRDQLVAAEKRMDRMQSKVASASHKHSVNGKVKTEPSSEASASPAPPPADDRDGGSGTAQEWEAIARFRSAELAKARSENESLRHTVGQLWAQIRAVAEEVVVASPYYRMLQEERDRLENARQDEQQTVKNLEEQLKQAEEKRTEIVDAATAASEHVVNELTAMLARRDNDNVRLRETRDQYAAELHERRQKEQVKCQALNEYKHLSESRSERIEMLKSEVTRLRSRHAAQTGDEDLLHFILRGYSEESKEYVDDIKERLRTAEARVAALEVTLSQRQQSDNAGDLRHEVDARERLAAAEKELEKYRSVYGDTSALPPDVTSLLERLQQREHEFERLTLQLTQQQEAEASIYAELDRLSSAWESLDKRLQSKVFDLSAMEDKLTRTVAEKAKVDNKYMAALRDKEASESERRQLSRICEKHIKATDLWLETQKKSSAQMSAAEKELNRVKTAYAHLANVDQKRRAEMETLAARVQASKSAFEKMTFTYKEHIEQASRERAQLQLAEEAALKAKKEAERQAVKLKAASQDQSASSSTREVQLQREVDQCMSILKCSTCRQNMRNTVITKCMHSFCKSCVDARVATRQRKCPACNLAFSQGEVQTLFFQ